MSNKNKYKCEGGPLDGRIIVLSDESDRLKVPDFKDGEFISYKYVKKDDKLVLEDNAN